MCTQLLEAYCLCWVREVYVCHLQAGSRESCCYFDKTTDNWHLVSTYHVYNNT